MPVDDASWVRLAGSSAVIVTQPAPGALLAAGADRLNLLHRLLTADLSGLRPGQGRAALLLTVKGQVVADLVVLAEPEQVVLLVPSERAASLAGTLQRYAVMDDFTVGVADDAILGVFGPTAIEALRAAGVPVPDALAAPLAHAVVETALDGRPQLHAVSARRLGARGVWLRGPSGAVAVLAAALRARAVPELPRARAEALRILALEPAADQDYGGPIAGERFPAEVGLGELIDHHKGCYLGQEPIVRIRDRGHVNWGLRAVGFAGTVTLRPGDPIEAEARADAGKLTSVGQLPGDDGSAPRGIALALVHHTVAAGTTLFARGADGRQPLSPLATSVAEEPAPAVPA